MGEVKELHYREKTSHHAKRSLLWGITVIGLPVAVVHVVLMVLNLVLALLNPLSVFLKGLFFGTLLFRCRGRPAFCGPLFLLLAVFSPFDVPF